jgi:hypothetical protein
MVRTSKINSSITIFIRTWWFFDFIIRCWLFSTMASTYLYIRPILLSTSLTCKGGISLKTTHHGVLREHRIGNKTIEYRWMIGRGPRAWMRKGSNGNGCIHEATYTNLRWLFAWNLKGRRRSNVKPWLRGSQPMRRFLFWSSQPF